MRIEKSSQADGAKAHRRLLHDKTVDDLIGSFELKMEWLRRSSLDRGCSWRSSCGGEIVAMPYSPSRASDKADRTSALSEVLGQSVLSWR